MGPMDVTLPVVLAPMAGVTNAPFRRMCREAAARGYTLANVTLPQSTPVHAPLGLYVCEMITSRALVEDTTRTVELITPDKDEFPKSVQLYGVVPSVMEKAAYIATSRGYADHIDLNFGCPVPKVTRKGGGAALPWKTSLLRDIVRAVIRGANAGFEVWRNDHDHPASTVPVTVKTRIGIDNEHVTFLDVGKISEDEGVAALTLHARTLQQRYSGRAHWEKIAELTQALTIPVLGNGDVFEGSDAMAMIEQTGCKGVVIGRGCQGRPWLFTDIVARMLGADIQVAPTLGEVCDTVLRHARLAIDHDGDEFHAMRDMRKHIGWYMRGFPVGGHMRAALAKVGSYNELAQLLGQLDSSVAYPEAAHGERGRKGSARAPKLPYGWLDSRELDGPALEMLKAAELPY
ncbi:MAG: tRNA dihydrouridine synthase DusB [Actinomycetaceae bacterium]|nr:tRNA dihydrouridine synthase DusB [Actinomycetaceae bacterium]